MRKEKIQIGRNKWKFYNRRIDRDHLNYITSNTLYKKDFFERNIKFFSNNSDTIYNAESSIISRGILRMINVLKATTRTRILRRINKCAIQHIYVTETTELFKPLHIGYESLADDNGNPDRTIGEDKSVVTSLTKLKDIDWWKDIEVSKRLTKK